MGVILDPIQATLGSFQLLSGIGQMFMGNAAEEQAAYNQAYNTTFQNSINKFRVDRQNEAIADQFSAKIDFVKQQIENNALAAQASWTAEQMRLNEVYAAAAFKSQAMQKMLNETLGKAAATEVYGKSAQRGALVANLGAYGRSRAQLAEQLVSERTAAQMRSNRIEQQMRARNKLAIAQISVIPQLAAFSPTPLPQSTSGGFGQSLMQIANVGLGASSTFFTGSRPQN